jgi:lysine N6-hydroxylase
MIYKLIGIGIGPTNLSLAALIKSRPNVLNENNVIFLDMKKSFSWHQNQMFNGSLMQNSFLRDLVTPIDPTSKFSFLNYLKSKNKLYQFLNTGITIPFREEYAQYMTWVSEQISFLKYSSEVISVEFNPDENLYNIKIKDSSIIYRALNLVIGTGIKKKIPFKYPKKNKKVIHVSDYLKYNRQIKGKNVVIIGSGQSSAELLYSLISNEENLPKKLFWITNDTNFRVLDTGNFSREYYTQEYAQVFYAKSDFQKRIINYNERNSGQGISPNLLDNIYKRLYYLKNVKELQNKINITPESKVESINENGKYLKVNILNQNTLEIDFLSMIDYAFCCTGFKSTSINFINDLPKDFTVNNDYTIKNIGSLNSKIYLQSYNSQTHSLSDPNLSLAAVRNGYLINQISNTEVYKLPTKDLMVNW